MPDYSNLKYDHEATPEMGEEARLILENVTYLDEDDPMNSPCDGCACYGSCGIDATITCASCPYGL
jgi:hypothetical protein